MDAWIVTLLVTIALFGNTASLPERKYFELLNYLYRKKSMQKIHVKVFAIM